MSDMTESMKNKIFDIINPNIEYTQEDFFKEFGNTSAVEFNTKISVKFINKSNNPNPEYSTEGASGFDFRANLESPIEIGVGKRQLIPTGLYFELPNMYELQVRPRSGLALKYGITVLNTPGTVDSDYRGEVCIILINHGENPFVVNHGDRIAQGVISQALTKNIISLTDTNEINNTERSSGGFGHTGIK